MLSRYQKQPKFLRLEKSREAQKKRDDERALSHREQERWQSLQVAGPAAVLIYRHDLFASDYATPIFQFLDYESLCCLASTSKAFYAASYSAQVLCPRMNLPVMTVVDGVRRARTMADILAMRSTLAEQAVAARQAKSFNERHDADIAAAHEKAQELYDELEKTWSPKARLRRFLALFPEDCCVGKADFEAWFERQRCVIELKYVMKAVYNLEYGCNAGSTHWAVPWIPVNVPLYGVVM
jgi:hypothetical protein